MIRREEARWKERVAGRKGGREKEARVRCEEGTGRGEVAAGGKRGSRHETATERRELAFTKHQNGTYRGPVISPYSFRIRIGKGRVRKRERSQIFSRVESRARENTHTQTRIAPVCLMRRWTMARKMSVSSIPAFLVALPELRTHHPVKEFSLSLLAKERGIGERYVGRDSLDKAQRNPYYRNERIRG